MNATMWLLGECQGAAVNMPAVADASQRHTVCLGGARAEYDASPECVSWSGFLAEMQQLFLGQEGDVMLGSVCVARLPLQGVEHQAAAPSCFANAAQWLLAAGCVGGLPPPMPAVASLHGKVKCISDVDGGGDGENEGCSGVLSDEDETFLFLEEDATVTELSVTLTVSAHSTAKQVADVLLNEVAHSASKATAVTFNLLGGRQVLRLARLAVEAPWMVLPARDFTGAVWAFVTGGLRSAGDALERPVPVVRRAVGVHSPAPA